MVHLSGWGYVGVAELGEYSHLEVSTSSIIVETAHILWEGGTQPVSLKLHAI